MNIIDFDCVEIHSPEDEAWLGHSWGEPEDYVSGRQNRTYYRCACGTIKTAYRDYQRGNVATQTLINSMFTCAQLRIMEERFGAAYQKQQDRHREILMTLYSHAELMRLFANSFKLKTSF